MTDVFPFSAFLSIMVLSRDDFLSACSSPGVRLGLVSWIESLRALISPLGRFLKPRKAGLVYSSLISREMYVALFLYRNICTGGAFERFLMCFLWLNLFLLRSFLFRLKTVSSFAFPLFIKTLVINRDKIHVIYSQERFWLHSKLRQVRWSCLLEFLLAYVHHCFVHC